MSNKVGRPPMYKTPEDLEVKIDEYLENPPTKTLTTSQGEQLEIPSITITGLCWFLGFESRQSFYEYGQKPEFTYIIKRARLFIENDYEQALKHANCTGSIFALKNMGWSDKQESENDQNIAQPLNINFTVKDPVSDIEVTKGERLDAT